MNRYERQIIVPEIGRDGQQRISQARVLIVGAGGLGTPVATLLVAAGVGHIGIMDYDTIATSNLNRQYLYTLSDIGKSKVETIVERLRLQNPAIEIQSIPCRLNEEKAMQFFPQFDIICDCTDNAESRILIDKIAFATQKPLVFAAVEGWEGYVTILHHRKQIRLQDIFSLNLLQEKQLLNMSGIVNTTCSVAGSIQATEVLKLILQQNSDVLDGKIQCFNLLKCIYKTFQIHHKS